MDLSETSSTEAITGLRDRINEMQSQLVLVSNELETSRQSIAGIQLENEQFQIQLAAISLEKQTFETSYINSLQEHLSSKLLFLQLMKHVRLFYFYQSAQNADEDLILSIGRKPCNFSIIGPRPRCVFRVRPRLP